MPSPVLKGILIAVAAALAGCNPLVHHPYKEDLPRRLPYDLVVQPAGMPAPGEQRTDSAWGSAALEAPSGIAHFRLVSGLPDHVKFEYRCQVRGVDAIPAWTADGAPCAADGKAYVQRFQARLTGPNAKYYRLRYECSTASKDSRGLWQAEGERPAEAWCGARDLGREEWVTRLALHVEAIDP
jgi:hypothetical protein